MRGQQGRRGRRGSAARRLRIAGNGRCAHSSAEGRDDSPAGATPRHLPPRVDLSPTPHTAGSIPLLPSLPPLHTHTPHTWELSSTGKRISFPSAVRCTLPSTTGDLRASAWAYRGPTVYTLTSVPPAEAREGRARAGRGKLVWEGGSCVTLTQNCPDVTHPRPHMKARHLLPPPLSLRPLHLVAPFPHPHPPPPPSSPHPAFHPCVALTCGEELLVHV